MKLISKLPRGYNKKLNVNTNPIRAKDVVNMKETNLNLAFSPEERGGGPPYKKSE